MNPLCSQHGEMFRKFIGRGGPGLSSNAVQLLPPFPWVVTSTVCFYYWNPETLDYLAILTDNYYFKANNTSNFALERCRKT